MTPIFNGDHVSFAGSLIVSFVQTHLFQKTWRSSGAFQRILIPYLKELSQKSQAEGLFALTYPH